jgi:hypothetical protein
VLHSEAVYDNTATNPNNPNSPPALVTVGEATTDEMMLYYFTWTPGLPSDESIVIDNSPHLAHHQDCAVDFTIGVEEVLARTALSAFPLPAKDHLVISLPFERGTIALIDPQGRIVHLSSVAGPQHSIDASRLARGSYVLEAWPAAGLPQRINVMLE